MATSSTLAAANTTAASSSVSTLSGGGSSGAVGGSATLINASAAQFREIHKNTWLKRLTAEGKKITVGPKKSDRSWVVFCVHDDTDALLEGYAEPRQAPSHNPEWTVSMQDTLHISHALIPNSHEFEFVVTLANEVIRFHAMSWEIMQEWVETLRSKLREMKILSPRENLYTKLPEIRAPLLPTRDPTSPLPAPPPVPAALVPGVERVVPTSLIVHDNAFQETRQERNSTTCATTTSIITQSVTTITTSSFGNNGVDRPSVPVAAANCPMSSGNTPVPIVSASNTQAMALPALTSMSNTLTQNLLNMLSDPISAYSEQINDVTHMDDSASSIGVANDLDFDDEFLSPILRNSQRKQEKSTSTTNADNSVRVDVGQRASADQIKNWESFVEDEYVTPTRLHTSRSLSAGAADSARKKITKPAITNNIFNNATKDNVTAFEISTDSECQSWQNVFMTSTTSDTQDEQLDIDKMNITIIEVSTNDTNAQESETNTNTNSSSSSKRVMGDIFKFPESSPQLEYKSNVQIIPSTKTNSNTIQVIGTKTNKTNTQYTATPVKKNMKNSVATTTTPATTTDELKITTVHVTGNTTTAVTPATNAATTTIVNALASTSAVSLYGTCYTTPASSNSTEQPISTKNMAIVNGSEMMEKIILSANSLGVTNITVNSTCATCTRSDTSVASAANPSDRTVKHNVGSVHYEKVFLSTSVPPLHCGTNVSTGMNAVPPISPNFIGNSPTPKRTTEVSTTSANKSRSTSKPSSPIPSVDGQKPENPTAAARAVSPSTTINVSGIDIPSLPSKSKHKVKQSPLMTRAHPPANASPVADRRRIPTAANLHIQTTTAITATSTSPPQPEKNTSSTTATVPTTASTAFHLPIRAHLLKRGLTEAVITTRPSRRDFHIMKAENNVKGKSTVASSAKNSTNIVNLNNNSGDNAPSTQQVLNTPNLSSSSYAAPNTSRNRNGELLEQRRRSSSTSDARTGGGARGTNNNELPIGRNSAALRFQQPPQPFRNAESSLLNGGGGSSAAVPQPCSGANNSPANMRMTLREHQVMQLRREIMHPGGVRLQLRRKDCVGSIAWVDAFGAVWVAGWKQKEHPVLYNALHIGDQLLSITGTAVTNANEANKIIRNSNTLFVEVLVRRIPFGRGYAIRREREGQCLGLIRDGNTATIVDVVPNSLAARHGLPPKAQSCDGSTLTFWVLTEINGRPLNLYFKDNEIRDRLNSVGRDISILVQPSDLVTKLKKQLKSLRGYKDYLVQ